MQHIKEEQISAYLDNQVDAAERRTIGLHMHECETCRAILNDLKNLNSLYNEAERFEPSPFLWNRIAASFEISLPAERSNSSWGAALISGLRRYAWNPGFAVAAAFGILMFAGVSIFRQNTISDTDRAALAAIDLAYQTLAAQNPDANNPFCASPTPDVYSNPFRSVRLSKSDGIR